MWNLKTALITNGVDHTYFLAKTRPIRKTLFIAYTSSQDPEVEMLCKIDEERYKIDDNYKLTLKPIYEGFAKQDYYVSDLSMLIKNGQIKMLIETQIN